MAWKIDVSHSRIMFSARHLMITTVRGEFEKFDINFNFNEQNPAASTVDVSIDAASINTRFGQRDDHLRSPDFLDAANHPTVNFKSTAVRVVDPNHAKLTGDLTIRGVTRPVTLDVESTGVMTTPWGATNAGFNARGKINRTDWGLNWNQVLEAGAVLVSEDVNIEIELEITRVADTTPVEQQKA